MKTKMRKLLKDNKGFTMIELMVVIVIMLILAAIAIPSFNRLINEAKETAATSEARTVLLLAQLEVESAVIKGTDVATAIGTEWTAILADAGISSTTSNFKYGVDANDTVYIKCIWGDESAGEYVELPETFNGNYNN